MIQAKLRIAFVGVGSMGQCAHLKNYAALEHCKIVAIAELRQELASKVAAKYGIPRIYPSHEQLLAHEKVDGIVASQPFSRHGTLIPELIASGIPVFTEKPIAASIEVGEKIVEAAKKANAIHMVGYHKRSDPATIRAIHEIDRLKASGEMGKLRYVRILMPAGDWIASGFDDLVRTDEKVPALVVDPPPADMDAATFGEYKNFVNYYIHQVNLMRHLLREPYTITYAEPSGVYLGGRSESGIACSIEMSPYTTSIDWQESALIAFEKGYIKIDLPAPLASNRPGRVEIFNDNAIGGPALLVPQLPWRSAMRQQAMRFCEVLRGEAPPPCDGKEALEDIKLARDYLRLKLGR